MKLLNPILFTLRIVWKSAAGVFLAIFVLTTILSLATIINTITFKEIVDSATGEATLFGLSLTGIILVRFGYELLKKSVEGVVGYLWQVLGIKHVIYMHRAFVDKVATLDLSAFENASTVGLIQRSYSRLQFQFKLYVAAIVMFLAAVVELATTIAIFFLSSPWLAILIVIANLVPIAVRAKNSYGVFMIYRSDDETRRKFGYTSNIVTERETLPEVKVNRAFGYFRDKLTRIYEIFTKKQLKKEKSYQLYNTLAEYVPTAMILVFSLVIANRLLNGTITTGLFVFLFTNIFSFQGALSRLGQELGHLHADSHFIDEVREFFELKPAVVFPTLKGKASEELAIKLKQPEITFENVSFAYANSPEKLVIKNINLTIPSGQNLALIGENGAGKSTLVKLLMRIYDPTEGRILINGVDLREIPESLLFALYSTLFQSFGKFNLTIRENLEMAAGRKLTEDEMKEYLQFSNAWEFVKDSKNIFNQQLGPEYADGTDISGGQWQRLAIARAYAKRAPILILDEPTSAVDARSEMEIFDRINSEMKVKTLIFISHRFSTIKDAERIAVLHKGKIVEEGTHRELMTNKGKYHALYSVQAERYQR